jgi:hypothetical protein
MNMTGNKKTVRTEDFPSIEDFPYSVIEKGELIAGFQTLRDARLFVDLLAQKKPPREGEIVERGAGRVRYGAGFIKRRRTSP